MNLFKFANEHALWANHNFPNTEVWKPLLGAGEELGELYHAVLKRAQNIRGTPEQHQASIKDAIGDILIYLDHFCILESLSLEACLEDAWEQVGERDWKRFPENGVCEICGKGMSCQGHDPIPAEPSGPLVMAGSGVHQSPRHIDDPQFAPHHANVKTCVCGGSGKIGTMFPVPCPCCVERTDPEILKTVTEDHPHE